MAPEVRSGKSLPSIPADCFALALLIHELLLRVHPFEAFADDSPDRFEQLMLQGEWLFDPARTATNHREVAVPTEILDPPVARLFRRGFSPNPTKRPSAREWRDVLLSRLRRVTLCPACGLSELIAASKRKCSGCQIPYPKLGLKWAGGLIRLGRSSTVITREMLGGKSTLSAQHARIRRDGPDYRIEDCSRNGIFRQAGNDWIRLPVSEQIERQPIIQAGDRLRFADVAVDVVSV